MLKQDGKPIDVYITLYEDICDRIPAAQVGTILADYKHVEYFVGGPDPQLLKLYVQDNQMFRNKTWEGTTKMIREAVINLKRGEDPIFRDNRRRYQRNRDQGLSTVHIDGLARQHRQQAAKHQQEVVDMKRKLDEADAR